MTPNRPSRVQVHGFQRVSSNSRSTLACGTSFREAIEEIEAFRRRNNNDSMFLRRVSSKLNSLTTEKQSSNRTIVFFIAYHAST